MPSDHHAFTYLKKVVNITVNAGSNALKSPKKSIKICTFSSVGRATDS